VIDDVSKAAPPTELELEADERLDPDYDLKQRLRIAKLERTRLAEGRTARDSQRILLEQLEEEERALRDDQAIEKAECEHGALGKRIAAVHTGLGVVIVKRPHHVLFRRFQDAGKMTSVEFEKLVFPCLVHPDRSAFESYVEQEPAMLLRVANAVATLAGARAEEVSGK
jgi:hypothetical protein